MQQALPDDSYTTEDHNIFTVAGQTCIKEGNSVQVLSIVLDEKNQVTFLKVDTNRCFSGLSHTHLCNCLHLCRRL